MPGNSNNKFDEKSNNETRIVALETDMSHVKEAMKRHEEAMNRQEEKIDKISEDVGQTNEHLARQNGAIPYMKTTIEEVRDMYAALAKKQQSTEVKNIERNTKVKIIIGAAALIGAAIVGALIRSGASLLFGM